MNVVEAPVDDFRDIGLLIERMREAGLTDVLVVGYDRNGELWTDINFVSGADGLWLLEAAKAIIMKSGNIL